jgi:hypothetical protein
MEVAVAVRLYRYAAVEVVVVRTGIREWSEVSEAASLATLHAKKKKSNAHLSALLDS